MRAIVLAAVLVAGIPTSSAQAPRSGYECLSFGCDTIRVIPQQARPVTCTITIVYDQSRPKASEIRYKGDGCEPTVIMALERALDVAQRADISRGGVYPAYPVADDVYRHRR